MMNLRPHHRVNRAAKTNAGGFSIIELMIAIFITLFLVGGMLGIIISMKGSFSSQDQLGRLHENELFGLSTLDNTIRQAGYFTDPTTTLEATAFPATAATTPAFALAQTVSGSVGTSPASDTITVRFQTGPSDGLMNCLGDTNKTLAAITWTNTFAVDNTTHQLTCTVTQNGAAPVAADTTPLIDNVASMKVLYGIATTVPRSADQYLTATSLLALSPVPKVVSVQLTLELLNLVNKNSTNLPHPVVHNINLMNTR